MFPIPPDTHWRDAKPIILPGRGTASVNSEAPNPKQPQTRKPKSPNKTPAIPPSSIAASGLRFIVPKDSATEPKPARQPRPKVKNDPRLVAAAREFRDRWLEQVNADPSAVVVEGMYDVSRRIEGAQREAPRALLLAEPSRSVA